MIYLCTPVSGFKDYVLLKKKEFSSVGSEHPRLTSREGHWNREKVKKGV